MVVVVSFSSLAEISGECLTIHSLPACFCFVFVFSGEELAHSTSTLYAEIGPQ